MPEYVYKAMTNKGQVVKNRVESSSKQALIEKLKNNDLTPIDVSEVSSMKLNINKPKKNISNIEMMNKNQNITMKEKIDSVLLAGEKVTNRDLVIFTQNFYLLKKADFNNIHALETIIESTENVTLKEILKDILAGVEAGDHMYTTMEYYSNVFPYIYVNMIKVGELSGSLEKSLEQAIKYLEGANDISKKVRMVMIPSILQFVALMVLLIVGTLIAVPTIQGVYDSVGSTDKLPGITLAFSDFINMIIRVWYIPVFTILIITIAIIYYIKTPKGRYKFDYFKYKMPIFGKLIYSLDFSRFIKAMYLNLNSGMKIKESLKISKNVIKNQMFLSMIETSINNLVEGESWIEPFKKSGLSSTMAIEMLNIGMQTELPAMMKKLSQYMEADIDNILARVMKVLPQVAYSIIGVVLILFVLIVLVPCLQVYMGNFAFSAAGL